jgi:AFG3 family protein
MGIVCQYGMVEKLGTINYTGGEEAAMKPFSERTGKIIDQEIRNIIDEQYQQCKKLLEEKRE